MSEDIREMVELAAVALGLKGRALERMEKRGHYVYSVSNGFERTRYDWLGDDGDSARMRSALLIDADWFGNLVQCSKDTHVEHEYYAEHNDRNAALRLATLKVAAEIGRRMKDGGNG